MNLRAQIHVEGTELISVFFSDYPEIEEKYKELDGIDQLLLKGLEDLVGVNFSNSNLEFPYHILVEAEDFTKIVLKTIPEFINPLNRYGELEIMVLI